MDPLKAGVVVAAGGVLAVCACSRGTKAVEAAPPAELVVPADAVAPDAELGDDAVAHLTALADIVTLMHHKDVEQTKPGSLPGVYSYDESTGVFTLDHAESGVPYGKTEKETVAAKATVQLKDKSFKPTFQTTFDSKPYTDRQGINFAGRVFIKHNYAQAVMVPVPGKLTYDPGGRTGDPHASERVGNS